MNDINKANFPGRKIIHIDMDCFYAAIEIRDNPHLKDKSIAVGGTPDQRGVLCTCNYIARQFGVRSAMASRHALKLCPDLIILPVNMDKYQNVAKTIHSIFREFSHLVEPLSLDEAYIDVSHSSLFQGSATLIAKEIRQQIWDAEHLTASAGIAPNKFLAKIASGWQKPDGLFVIPPHAIEQFVRSLSVDELYGVGKITAKKLHQLGLKTCADLQTLSLVQLTEQFGKLGEALYNQSRGIDLRPVEPNRIRKSVSVEHTFSEDVMYLEDCVDMIDELFDRLSRRLQQMTPCYPIKNQFIKLKLSDFTLTTTESISDTLNRDLFRFLFQEAFARHQKSIRLIGLGVHFNHTIDNAFHQMSLFD